jgi:hypothetical protein
MSYLDKLTDAELDALADELAREVARMYPSLAEVEAMRAGRAQARDNAIPDAASPPSDDERVRR